MKISDFIKSFKNSSQYKSEYEENIAFSISIGEICQSCQVDLPLFEGGYTGAPTLCKSCLILEKRELKLNQLLNETDKNC